MYRCTISSCIQLYTDRFRGMAESCSGGCTQTCVPGAVPRQVPGDVPRHMFRGMYKDKFRGMYKDKFRGMCLDMFRGMYKPISNFLAKTDRRQTEDRQTDRQALLLKYLRYLKTNLNYF